MLAMIPLTPRWGAVLLALCILCTAPAGAANRFHLSTDPLLALGNAQEIVLLADNDIDVYGFSFGIDYDETKLSLTDVTSEDTLSAGSDYFAGEIDAATGRAGYGCVFDFFDDTRPPGTDFLTPGTDRPLAKLIVNVLAATDTTTTVTFQDIAIVPQRPVRNVMTNEAGRSVLPLLVPAELTIETRRPRIISLDGNSGLPGTVFTVTGEFFGEPGLAVTVCGAPAAAALQPDGMTLQVTAPPCGALDAFAPIEVCTTRGCDSRTEGFFYESRRPRIVSLSGNSGLPGTVFTVTGEFFGEPGLAVTVCDAPAAAELQPDGMTLRVTAPPCGTVDAFAPIEVCTTRGCDSRTDGFFYGSLPGALFLRGDCNADGQVSGVVTDAVFMLNFNFLGGTRPPCVAACDANSDGAFAGTVTDAVYLLNFNFLGGPPPAPPYPACDPGDSPEDVALGCETPFAGCGV